MAEDAILDSRAGYNSFVEGRTVRPDLPPGKRGKKADTRYVFALVVDSDEDKGAGGNVEPETSLEIVTSPAEKPGRKDNRHLWSFFDVGLTLEEADRLGKNMSKVVGADHATGVVTQCYRVAGTVNFPTKAKQARGRTTPHPTHILKVRDILWTAETFAKTYPATVKAKAPILAPANPPPGAVRSPILRSLVAAEIALPSLDLPIRHETGRPYDRSGWFQRCVNRAFEASMTPDEVEQLMLANPQGCCEKFLEEGRLREEIKRSWESAAGWVPTFEDGTPAARPDWIHRCMTTKGGEPLPNLANVMLALREDPAVRDMLSYNEMLCAAMLNHPVPAWGEEPDLNVAGYPRPVTDADVGRLQEYLQHAGLRKIGKDLAHQAADIRAQECAYHPVRQYLSGLVWDGVPRIGTWLSAYLGAERTPYTDEVGKLFLLSTVARIERPGCKVDYMIVLEGDQGVLKSTTCRILAGPWFSDNLPDLRLGKEVAEHLPGKWIIEIAEMSAMGKVESAALKAFITRAEERYRPSYGRREVIQPRQCVFIGTTNKAAYLRDETGGRRFWPVKVGRVDADALARDRNQLFAEAVHLFREGAKWWPDSDFERVHIAPEQEARFEADVWEESISKYLENKSSVLVYDVARHLLGNPFLDTPVRISRDDQKRITQIMDRLGWERSRKPDRRGRNPWVPKG